MTTREHDQDVTTPAPGFPHDDADPATLPPPPFDSAPTTGVTDDDLDAGTTRPAAGGEYGDAEHDREHDDAEASAFDTGHGDEDAPESLVDVTDDDEDDADVSAFDTGHGDEEAPGSLVDVTDDDEDDQDAMAFDTGHGDEDAPESLVDVTDDDQDATAFDTGRGGESPVDVTDDGEDDADVSAFDTGRRGEAAPEALTPAAGDDVDATVPDRDDHGDEAADVPTAADDGLPLIEESESFRSRWQSIQVSFVDDPHQALTDAGQLADDVVGALVAGAAAQRDRLSEAASTTDLDTEQLRVLVRRYRDYVERLLSV